MTRARSRSAHRASEEKQLQLALLRLGDETYAVDIMRIKGIVNPSRITPVPRAPSFIEGVIELRGEILPIVDLRKRLGLPAVDTRSTKYVLAGIAGKVLGLVVDGVQEVVRVPESGIRPAPRLADGEAGSLFPRACQHEGRIVMIIDLDALLTAGEQGTLAALGATPPGRGGP